MVKTMDFQTFLSQYLLHLIVYCGFHLTYFQLFRFMAPSIAKDRKRLAWIITFTTAVIVVFVSPFYTWGEVGTIFSSPSFLESQRASALGNKKIDHDYRFFPTEFNSNAAVLGQDSQTVKGSQPTIVTMDPSLLGLHKATERSFSQEDTEHPDSKEKTERGRNEAITRDAHSRADKSALATKKQDQGQRQLRLFFDLRFTPEDNSGTINLVVFFMAYLIMDLTLGFLYYREQVTLLAGWLHHIVYIGITYYAVTRGETYSYALYMPMEAPTIVVGIGCLSKSLRRDMLYGITFIFFRIIFAYSITHEIIWNREREVSITLKSILIFKSLMHLKFLQGWISQQKRLARKRRAEAAAKASEASMLTDPQTKGTEVGSKIVSITAPTIKMGSTVSRKSVHVLREQQQPPVLREDLVAVSTSVESTSRSTVTRSKKARGDELIDVQPVVDMVAVH